MTLFRLPRISIINHHPRTTPAASALLYKSQSQTPGLNGKDFFHTTRRKMALPPKFSGQILPLHDTTSSSHTQPHTLEFFLDYVCPFSAKQFLTFYDTVLPLIRDKYRSPGVNVVFRQQIQPWHPSSTLVHEAAVAVLQAAPDKFWPFSRLLMQRQKEYFDVNVVHETRNETYKRLAKLAAEIDGVDEKAVFEKLVVSDKPGEDGGFNIGNEVTNDLKVMVKMGRLVGVHVSPSVIFDGIMENSISSGWGKKEWEEWLEKNLK